MTARFQRWFDWLLTWEGTSFENDPHDHGGATKFGIDQRSHPDEDIRDLTRERAAEIYWASYWNCVHAEALPPGVGEVVANIAVNTGYAHAAQWLQAACGAPVDGSVGVVTIAAANDSADHAALARRLITRTETFYRTIALGSQAKFLKGWLNRNADLARFIGLKP